MLHGPAAFLFGFPLYGGIGGVVNLVPKRADDTPLTRAIGSFFSTGNGEGSFDIGRRFGEGNALGVRANGFYQDGSTPVDHQSFQNGGTTLGLDWHGDRARVSLDLGYHHLGYVASTEDISVLPGFQVPRAPTLTRNVQQPWEHSATDYGFGLLKMEYDITNNWTAFASVGGSHTDEHFVFNSYTIQNPASLLGGYTFVFPDREDQFTAEAGLRGGVDIGPFHNALSIVATTYDNNNPHAYNLIPAAPSNLYRPILSPVPAGAGTYPKIVAPQTENLVSIAAADTLTVIPDLLDLIGGVREQGAEERVHDATSGLLTSDYDKSALTPLGAAVLKIDKQISLYASYAEGLSFGPTAPNTAVNAGESFPPLVSTQLETGAKADFGNIGASLAFYQIDQPQGFTDPTTRVFSVAGQQRNQGIDFDVFGTPSEGIRLLGGVTLLNGVLTKTAGDVDDGK